MHLIIGDLVDEVVRLREKFIVVRDSACVEKNGHNLPLFYKGEGTATSEFTNVDILILDKDEKTIKIIIEIEESNMKPIHILGKFLAAASCSHYIYGLDKFEMAEDILFIQVLKSKFENKSKKPEQWMNIEQSIKSILPVLKSKNLRYKLIFGESMSFKKGEKKREEMVFCVSEFL